MTDLNELLSELHAETIKSLLARIRSGEATSADHMAAARILSDNGKRVAPKKANGIDEKLKELLPFDTVVTEGEY